MGNEGLRAALDEALATVEQGIARSTKPDREGFLMTSHIREMLAAHPEPSEEEIARVLHDQDVSDGEAIPNSWEHAGDVVQVGYLRQARAVRTLILGRCGE